MNTILEVMEGLVVPLTEQDLIARWKQRGTIAKLRDTADNEERDRRLIRHRRLLKASDEGAAYQNSGHLYV